jgi:quinol monooxygenase YgiN
MVSATATHTLAGSGENMNLPARLRASALLACTVLAGTVLSVQAADESVTVIARYWVTPGREAEAEPRFRRALEFMQRVEPGSTFKMYRVDKEPNLFVYIEVYPSRAALEEHRKTTNPARAKELGPTPEGLLARPPEIQELRLVGS